MSFVEHVCEKVAPYLKEREKVTFNVAGLDEEHQVVCTGRAVLEHEALVGTFWPGASWPVNKNPADVTVLKQSHDNKEYQVHNFHRCQSEVTDHYHFRIYAMRLWKLTPINPSSPHMEASWHRDFAIVRASHADAARELATTYLTIAVESIPSRDTLFSPWGQCDIVACDAYEGSDFARVGEPCVLRPICD